MSKSKADTKRRILAVYRILKVNNMLTLREIKSRLSNYYQIDVSRTTLYDDLNAITEFDFVEMKRMGGKVYYYLSKE